MINKNKINKPQFLSTKKTIIKWLDKYHIKNYTINDDLSVDVDGYVNISRKNLKIIPVKFGTVTGDFWCDDNKITSLAGSPTTIGYNFNCSNNPLTSLFELNNCTFKNIIFNIDRNILKKEELELLKKYYNFKGKIYILTNEEFHDTVKPILQKNHLFDKISNTEIYTKTKTPFI